MALGNVATNQSANHIFVINNHFWQSYGCSTFTLKGFESFSETDFGKKVIQGFNPSTASNSIFATNRSDMFSVLYIDTGYYRKYNQDTGLYEKTTITPTAAKDLIEYHESGRAGTNDKDETKDKQIDEINGSVEGCIYFYRSSYSTPPTNPNITPEEVEANNQQLHPDYPRNGLLILKLYFYAPGSHKYDRTLTQKSNQLFTGTPRTATGRKFSLNNSKTLQSQSDSDGNPNIGQRINANKNAEDSNDAVSAPIMLSYDETTGHWLSPGTILARLLTSLDPAGITSLNIGGPNDLDGLNSQSFYSKGGSYYMGQKTTGYAMPLSMEKGNPDMYGPNIFKCDAALEVEKIIVVNRSNYSFKMGDMVLCSFISGEWIVQKYGDTTTVSDLSIGRWGFYKFIANSDWFFREKQQSVSFNTLAGNLTDLNNNLDNAITTALIPPKALKQDKCQTILHNKFYADDLLNQAYGVADDTARASNIGKKLNQYLQTTSFDNTSAVFGGTANAQYFKLTNQFHTLDTNGATISINDLYAFQLPVFWGPVFVEGYSNSDYSKIKAATGSGIVVTVDSGNNYHTTLTEPYLTGIASISNIISTYNTGLVNSPDMNFYHIPADIATNGNYSSKSFPIEDTSKIISSLNSVSVDADASGFRTAINNHINTGYNYFLVDNATVQGSSGNVYGFTPINKGYVQFTPLCPELICATDANGNNAKNIYRKKDAIKQLFSYLKVPNQTPETSFDSSPGIFGRMYGRCNNSLYTNITSAQPEEYAEMYSGNFAPFTGIPYDTYIQFDPLSKPIGVYDTFYNAQLGAVRSGSNLVGIIAARNSFNKRGGGVLNIETNQRFGMYGRYDVANKQDFNFIVLPDGNITLGFTNKSQLDSRFLPAWGSDNNDSIDSFGTTALHVMVWDWWPDNLTVFIPQYFSVMHFNPGQLGSTANTKELKYQFKPTPSSPTDTKTLTYDIISYDIDLLMPTKHHIQTDPNGNQSLSTSDGSQIVFSTGTTITRWNNQVAPTPLWKVNTKRRGKLVTYPGYFYTKLAIGLDQTGSSITKAGTGFGANTRIKINDALEIKINDVSDGGITSWNFYEELVDGLSETCFGGSDITKYKNVKRGEGFTHSSFTGETNQEKYELNVPSPTPGGTSAVIKFTQAIVYEQYKRDLGPKQRCSTTRLSLNSKSVGRVEGTKTTTLNVDSNQDAKYKNRYEAFYFFHNDIGHSFQLPTETDPAFSQYITMQIT